MLESADKEHKEHKQKGEKYKAQPLLLVEITMPNALYYKLL